MTKPTKKETIYINPEDKISIKDMKITNDGDNQVVDLFFTIEKPPVWGCVIRGEDE